jgi:ketosteroid isomerase-like protein
MVPMTNDEVAKQISVLEDRRYQAMTDADVAALGELLSDDVVYTHSDATADSKQSYLQRIADGYFDYGPVDHPESSVLVRGDTALVFGDMRGEVHINGQLRVLSSRCLAVWMREGSGWALVAWQPTKYPA